MCVIGWLMGELSAPQDLGSEKVCACFSIGGTPKRSPSFSHAEPLALPSQSEGCCCVTGGRGGPE